MNSSDAAEEFRRRDGGILPVECVSFGDQERAAAPGGLLRRSADNPVDKEAFIAFEQDHLAYRRGVEGRASYEYKIAGANPRVHASAQYAETHRTVRANFLRNRIDVRALLA